MTQWTGLTHFVHGFSKVDSEKSISIWHILGSVQVIHIETYSSQLITIQQLKETILRLPGRHISIVIVCSNRLNYQLLNWSRWNYKLTLLIECGCCCCCCCCFSVLKFMIIIFALPVGFSLFLYMLMVRGFCLACRRHNELTPVTVWETEWRWKKTRMTVATRLILPTIKWDIQNRSKNWRRSQKATQHNINGLKK